MMHDDGVGALLRFEVKALGQTDGDVLLGMKKGEALGLVLKVRAGRIAEGIARTAILLVKTRSLPALNS